MKKFPPIVQNAKQKSKLRMIYAVFDTNVLVSALMSKSDNSTIVCLITAILQNKITPLYHAEILKEYEEVLGREKFHFLPSAREAMINIIKSRGVEVSRIPYNASMLDEDDRVFYEVTLSKEDAYLVTGNQKHFPNTPIVVTPAEMLEILVQQQK